MPSGHVFPNEQSSRQCAAMQYAVAVPPGEAGQSPVALAQGGVQPRLTSHVELAVGQSLGAPQDLYGLVAAAPPFPALPAAPAELPAAPPAPAPAPAPPEDPPLPPEPPPMVPPAPPNPPRPTWPPPELAWSEPATPLEPSVPPFIPEDPPAPACTAELAPPAPVPPAPLEPPEPPVATGPPAKPRAPPSPATELPPLELKSELAPGLEHADSHALIDTATNRRFERDLDGRDLVARVGIFQEAQSRTAPLISGDRGTKIH